MLMRSRLIQNIVRQIVVLIHQQIPVQVRRSRASSGSASEQLPQRAWPFARRTELCFCCSSENVPFQKKCASSGSQQDAFEHALQLVLQADLVVGHGPVPLQRARACSAAARGRHAANGAHQPVRAIGQIAAEQARRRPRPTAPPSRAAGSSSKGTRPAARPRPRSVRRNNTRNPRSRSAVPRPGSDRTRDGRCRRAAQSRGSTGSRRNCAPGTRPRTSSAAPRCLPPRNAGSSTNPARRSPRRPAARPKPDARARDSCSSAVQFFLRRVQTSSAGRGRIGSCPIRLDATSCRLAIPASARAAASRFPRSASAAPGT